MNSSHLGDVFDGWKNWILNVVFGHDNFHVVPMITDESAWNRCHKECYAWILGTNCQKIVQLDTTFKHDDRKRYMDQAREQIAEGNNIFFDPDNSITSKLTKKRDLYITVQEVVEFLDANNKRIAAVYVHEDRSLKTAGIQTKLGKIISRSSGVCAFGICCGEASLLCFSRNTSALKTLYDRVIKQFDDNYKLRITDIVPTQPVSIVPPSSR